MTYFRHKSGRNPGAKRTGIIRKTTPIKKPMLEHGRAVGLFEDD